MRPTKFKQFFAVLTLCALLPLTACAAEDSHLTPPGLKPGTVNPGVPSSDAEGDFNNSVKDEYLTDEKFPDASNQNNAPVEIPEARKPVEAERSHEFPAGFPSHLITLSNEFSVFDAGQRSAQEWYAVLEFDSSAAAKQYVNDLKSSKALSEETAEENSVSPLTLIGSDHTIEIIQMQDGQKYLLNLEIEVL